MDAQRKYLKSLKNLKVQTRDSDQLSMMNQYPWAMGLKIPKDTIAAWEIQAAGSDLLRWALANGKLPEFGYQEWAKSYYQLPSLDTQFFDQPPSPELWAKWGNYAWAGTFLPIYEWEGTLYLACLEPPNFEQSQLIEQLNTRVGLLIAPMSGMKKWWSILSPVTQNTQQAPSSNLPPGLAQFTSNSPAQNGAQVPVQSNQNQAPQVNQVFGQTPVQNQVAQPVGVSPAQQTYQNQNTSGVVSPVQNTSPQNSGQANWNQAPQAGGVNQAPQAAVVNQAAQVNQQTTQQSPHVSQQDFNQHGGVSSVSPGQAYSAPAKPAEQQSPVGSVVEGAAKPVAPPIPAAHPTPAPENIPPSPEHTQLSNGDQPVVAEFTAVSAAPSPIEVKEQEPVVPNINLGIEDIEEEAPIMDASFPVDIPESPKLKQVDKSLTETKELPDGPEEFKLEVPEAPEFTTTHGNIDPTNSNKPGEEISLDSFADSSASQGVVATPNQSEAISVEAVVPEAPVAPELVVPEGEFTLDLEADVKIDPSANLSTENVDKPEEVAIDFEAMQAEADQHNPSAEVDFELKLDDDFSVEAAAPAEQEENNEPEAIEGLQGLDLAGGEDVPQLEGLDLSQNIPSAPEAPEEDEVEGLDFSSMLKEEDASSDFGMGGVEAQSNVNPPSAHLVPDEVAPMPSSLDVAESVSAEPLKVAHHDEAPVAPAAVSAEQASKDVPIDASVEDRLGYKALTDFSQYFDRVMILQPNQMLLKPTLWQGNWHHNKSANTNIDITMSSIFRIVFTSKKPYHGYVVRNQINDSFFITFNQGELPDHATIVPVMIDNNLVAMILGFTDQNKAEFVNLEDCERIAEKYAADLLEHNRSQLQAA